MSAIAESIPVARRGPRRASRFGTVLTLARRRAMLTASNPRQIAVPLLGPVLLAVVVAPALKVATGGLHSNIDYQAFVGVGHRRPGRAAQLHLRRAKRDRRSP